MKKIIAAAMMMAASFAAKAQNQKEWAPFAHWVLETNVKTPRTATIKFYNDKLILVYQETIKGRKMNIGSKKVRKTFDEVLQQVMSNQTNDTALIAARLKINTR